MRSPRLALAAFLLSGCCCFTNGESTPLDAPVESDHARANATFTMSNGSGFVRGANDFTVAITNVDHTPATLTHVRATMPADGHAADATSIELLAPGQYRVHGLDLTMAGTWAVRLTVSQTGATDDDQVSVIAVVD